MKTLIKLSALVVLVTAYCFQPLAQTVIFTPSDDATIFQNGPNSNSGESANMTIRNQFGGTDPYFWGRDGLVNFDINSVPANAEILSAKLHLYYHYYWDNNPAGRTLNCYRIAAYWDEMTVTWNNQPSCLTQPTAGAVVPSSVGQWMTWDVTADVQQIVNDPDAVNHGWKITDEQYWGWVNIPITYFYTKENGSYIPYLEVDYVSTQTPGWEVIGGTQFNMTMLAAVTFNDDPFIAEGDNLAAAFGPGGEDDCRALGVGQNGLWNFTIVSNVEEDQELISFKIFNAEQAMIYDCNETIYFENNAIIGSPDNPFLLTVTTYDQQQLDLTENWNWISFNIHPYDASIENIFGVLGDNIQQVKNQTQAATWFGDGHGWMGDLTHITDGEGYLVNMVNAFGGFKIKGDFIDHATPISLSEGWNWIGYYPQQPLSVGEALLSIEANAIQVKSQSQSATWFEDTGWIGDMEVMEPGKGYKINMQGDDVLIYQTSATQAFTPPSIDKKSSPVKTITGNKMNMVVIAIVESDHVFENITVSNSKDEYVAVGKAFEYEGKKLWYFTIAGNDLKDIIRFSLSDNTLQNSVTCVEQLMFDDNASIGTPSQPFKLTLPSEAIIYEAFSGFELSQNFPNPFRAATHINYMLPVKSSVKLTLFDITGKEVMVLIDETQAAGQYSLPMEKGLLEPGIYFYRMKAASGSIAFERTRKMTITL
jgi:hypothetical protein